MDNNSPISKKILDRIEGATPRSRSYFVAKNVGMWVLAGLSIILGALAISSIIFRLVNAGPALRPGTPPLGELLLVVPFIWVICVVAFGYMAYREIRSTNRGYKYELSTLILGMVLASCVLGIVFYATGTGFALDRFAARHLPFHADLERIQEERWLQPEEGFLVGKITGETDDGLILTDPQNTQWQVRLATEIPDDVVEEIQEGERVGVHGEEIEDHTFLACDIRSLEFEGRGPLPPSPHAGRKDSLMRSNGCEDVRPLD